MTHPDSAAPAGTQIAVVEAPNSAMPLRSEGRAMQVERVDPLTSAVEALTQLRELATMLVATGFLPRSINTPEKAIAVMLTGREMGLGPMQSIRSINIIDAKPVVAADLQLALFKKAGGRGEFSQLDEHGATLTLIMPNGDRHTESFTMKDAQSAGLLAKDNWKKHPKAMLRSRVITAALKSIGYEATTGVYDPDEADHMMPGASERIASEQTTSALAQLEGSSSTSTPPRAAEAQVGSRYVTTWPIAGAKFGFALDRTEADGTYTFTDAQLDHLGRTSFDKLNDTAKPAKDPEKLKLIAKECDAELQRRAAEKDAKRAEG